MMKSLEGGTMALKKFVVASALLAVCGMALAQGADPRSHFAPEVNGWKLKGAKALDAVAIFDYMDGAAEPYMTYTYKQLYVGQYAKGDQELVVEMYDMGSPPEAYGAYTLEVEGAPASVGSEALQNDGALRVWKGQYFIKIFSSSASAPPGPEAIEIGKAIADKIAVAGEKPKLLAVIPAVLKPAKFRYFHKNEIFSDIFYVSTKNVLELSEKTDAAWAECKVDSAKPKVCVIKYADATTRDKAWDGLCAAVFVQPNAGKGKDPIYAEQLELKVSSGIRKFSGTNGEPLLGLCFEAQTPDQCTKVLQSLGAAEQPKGGQ
jgi:hypothetical protein